jgi:hypothetical protein
MAVLVLGGLALVAIAIVSIFALLGAVLHFALRLILLPLLLLKWLVVSVVMLVAAPVVFVVSLIAFVVVAVILAVPLMPLLMLGGLAWLIVRANRRPVVA